MGKEWDRLDAPPVANTGDVFHDPSVVGGFQDGAGGNPFSRSRIRYGRGSNQGTTHSMMAWHANWLTEAFRVLRPGGVIKAFSATRTFHRMAAAMAEAGFVDVGLEAWTYGSGFPKSLNVSVAIDKSFGAERKVIGSKRGTGADPSTGRKDMPGKAVGVKQVAIDVPITAPATEEAAHWEGWGTALKPAWEPVLIGRKPL